MAHTKAHTITVTQCPPAIAAGANLKNLCEEDAAAMRRQQRRWKTGFARKFIGAQSGAVPLIFALIGLVAGPAIDQGVNYAIGGKPGYTISGEAGLDRMNGKPWAKAACGFDQAVAGWYDVRFINDQGEINALAAKHHQPADHCFTWAMVGSNELAEAIALRKPVDYSAADWRVGLRGAGVWR